jgi:hypothetical protein
VAVAVLTVVPEEPAVAKQEMIVLLVLLVVVIQLTILRDQYLVRLDNHQAAEVEVVVNMVHDRVVE